MQLTADTSVKREEAKAYLIERQRTALQQKRHTREAEEIERYANERMQRAMAVKRAAKEFNVPPSERDFVFEEQLSKVLLISIVTAALCH